MAKSYTTTINVACWKAHTCVSCGANYQYWFKRKVTGKAPSATKSQQRAAVNRDKALANEVDLHPCPACGIYQPDMIGQQRARSHTFTFWIALSIFAILLIARAADGLQANVALWICGVAAGLALLQFAVKDFKNLNRDPQSNLQKLAGPMTQGTVQLASGTSAQPAPQWMQPPRSPIQTIVLAAMGLAVMLIVSAELLRIARGWPLNAAAYPPVVGPGDSTRVYMNQTIDSIKSYWRGDADVQLSEAGGSQIPGITATTNDNTWGQTISDVKSSEEHNTSTPWVHLQLPDDANLAGKTVQGQIALAVERPVMGTGTTYHTEQSMMNRDLTLKLAKSPHAGADYNHMWWGGSSIGMIVLLMGGWALIRLAHQLRRHAPPTRTFLPAPAPAAPPALPPLPT